MVETYPKVKNYYLVSSAKRKKAYKSSWREKGKGRG